MAYTPTAWANNVPPPLSAANLNKLTDELEAQASECSIEHSLPTWVDGAAPALTEAVPLNEMEQVCAAVASSVGLTYTPTSWGTGWTPSRNALRLNRLEAQVAANRAALDAQPPSLLYANTVWDSPPGAVDPNSSTIIPFWLTYALVSPNLSNAAYGVATAVSSPTDPAYTVNTGARTTRLDSSIRIPLGVTPTTGSDKHLAVYDPDNNRAHDLYQAAWTGSGWTAGGGQSASTLNNGLLTGSFWGSNAAKFPLLAGLITPEEIAAGYIPHALVFGNPDIGQGAPRFPAMSNVATAPTSDSRYIVEGTRLQLNPALNVASLGLPAWQATIARAMQDFGMFLRDNSGSLAIYAEDTRNRGGGNVWTDVGVPANAPQFSSSFPWSQMRVLVAPPSS